MADQETPAWLDGLIFVLVAAITIWALWATVIGFIGGTIPLTGIHIDGGLIPGLLMLFIGVPIMTTVARLVCMAALVPLFMIFARRTS